MLKALGAVQAVSDGGRDQRISEQEGTSETAGQIRNGRSPVLGHNGQSPGLSLFPVHPPRSGSLCSSSFYSLGLGYSD